jgi:hypothetical protein
VFVIGGSWLVTPCSTWEDDQTTVLFKHLGWREPLELMHHGSTTSAMLLMSLRSLVETGSGSPDPHAVRIDNWNPSRSCPPVRRRERCGWQAGPRRQASRRGR